MTHEDPYISVTPKDPPVGSILGRASTYHPPNVGGDGYLRGKRKAPRDRETRCGVKTKTQGSGGAVSV